MDWNQAYLTLAALLWLFNTVNSHYRVLRPGRQPSLSQFRGSLVDSLVVRVSLWKWSCFGADVHRNLRYSPGVVFWVTGCKGQRGANGTANLKVPLWSLFVRCWQLTGKLVSLLLQHHKHPTASFSISHFTIWDLLLDSFKTRLDSASAVFMKERFAFHPVEPK